MENATPEATPETEKGLTSSTLKDRWWWRLAQVGFVVLALFIFIATFVISGSGLTNTSTVVTDQSTLSCDNGESVRLDIFMQETDIYFLGNDSFNPASYITAVGPYDQETVTFANNIYNAKAKMFCVFSSIGEDFDPIAFNQYYSGTNKQQIDEENFTPGDIDMRYSITLIRDYTELGMIVIYTFIALIVEVILLFALRGVARYTLIGRFL